MPRKSTRAQVKESKRLDIADLLRECAVTEDIDRVIELSKHPDASVRKRALVEMCPCRVKGDVEPFWERVFEMTDDVDRDVRQQVLHTLCDGSPVHLEDRVMLAVESFNGDEDRTIRRQAHKVLGTYRTKGKWNIM